MRKVSIACLAIAASFTCTAVCADGIPWIPSLPDAMRQAKASHQLAMVELRADWSASSKRLDETTLSNPDVVRAAGVFFPVRMSDDEEGKRLARKYHATGFPTVLFLDGTGVLEGRISGYLPPEPFIVQMTQFNQNFHDFPILLARFSNDQKDAEAAARLAGIYAARDDLTKAARLLTQAYNLDPNNHSGELAKAYNAAGDAYQNHGDLEHAIACFQKAAAVGHKPEQVAYADLSLAQCYDLQWKKPQMIAALRATIAVPGCPPDLRATAQAGLEQAEKPPP